MVGHQTKPVHLYPILTLLFFQCTQVIEEICFLSKDDLFVVTALHDVVRMTWQDDSS
jgi:hypothetical protein